MGTKKIGDLSGQWGDESLHYILLDLLFRMLLGGLTAFHENIFKQCFVHNCTLKLLCKSFLEKSCFKKELFQHC